MEEAMHITRADEAGGAIREQLSALFVEGFGHELRMFSKDANRLAKAFEHIFIPEAFYVLLIDNELASMMACVDLHSFCVAQNRKELQAQLGFLRGLSVNSVFNHYFRALPKYSPAIETNDKTGSIEFVATSEKYRGRGLAAQLMRSVFEHTEFDNYLLEVADTNAPAMALYSRIGYQEVYRKKAPVPKMMGINNFVYMKYSV
jgi:ribosomal protein S18 acetylase RimI-like enzyme